MSLQPMPPLILMEDHQHDWEIFITEVYKNFLETVVQNKELTFLGLPISCPRKPEVSGMHSSFWHLVTEDLEKTYRDEDRTPDIRRCERILWISHVIEQANVDNSQVHCWEKKVKSNKHIVLWVEQENFVIVLAKRKDYLLLKTIYQHNSTPHKKRKLVKDKMNNKDPRDSFKKTEAA